MTDDLDDYHFHEALDRASMVADIVDRHLASHPVVEGTPELSDKVTKALQLLHEVYQLIGEMHL